MSSQHQSRLDHARFPALITGYVCLPCILFVCVILQVRNYKLVSDGIIRPEIFYKALTVWIDRDVLGYAFSQVCFKNNESTTFITELLSRPQPK